VATEFECTDELQGARFTRTDLSGARFRDVDLRGAKIADSDLTGVAVSGGIKGMRVNGVEVAPLVEAELDRRHPERITVRAAKDPDTTRVAWELVEALWAATHARARQLPEGARQARVDEEWSFTETLRHLVFVTDAWASRTILGEERPFHAFGLWTMEVESELPARRELLSSFGLDIDSTPTFDEVLAVRLDRMAVVRRIVEEMTPEQWARPAALNPAPGHPAPAGIPAGMCLGVVVQEEYAHHQYAIRDLEVLESRIRGGVKFGS
jgi:hypothetical protein